MTSLLKTHPLYLYLSLSVNGSPLRSSWNSNEEGKYGYY